jgi:dCMP deaminase
MNKWQQAYMDTAERFGALSTAKRLQVGAIVVKDNRIISIGYNGMPSGWNNECEDENFKTKPEVLHAEENAIAKLASSHESGKGSEIYITHSPCMNCAKLIYASGIAKVYYKHKYRSEDGIHFLEKCGLEVKQL